MDAIRKVTDEENEERKKRVEFRRAAIGNFIKYNNLLNEEEVKTIDDIVEWAKKREFDYNINSIEDTSA